MAEKTALKLGGASGESQLHERVIVDRLTSAVMEQRLSPGTKLSEAALCETFGVGRMHVRRALLMLANQGIVDLQSNRGAFIARPGVQEARDIFATRLILEPTIIKSVIENAESAELCALRDHIDLEQKARKRRNRREAIRLSGEFHVRLAEAAGNAVMSNIVRDLVTRSSLIIALFGTTDASACQDDEHLQILDAVSVGDGKKAARLVRVHLEHIEADLDLRAGRDTDKPNLSDILSAP